MIRRLLTLCLSFYVCPSLSAPLTQTDGSSSEANRGTIQNDHIYANSALGITMSLPGSWEFMEIDAYSSPEQKAKEKAEEERIRAHCSGPFCGPAEIKEALRYALNGRPVSTVFVLAYKLSEEFQNRQRHSLLDLASIMAKDTTSNGWIVDENLAPMSLSGRRAYRLLMHNAKNPQGKGFIYVADSNGFVFMLVATSVKGPDELQIALENMRLEPKHQ
jgi:hypothetical protein